MRKEVRGYVAVLGAAALWGIGGVIAKFLFTQAMSPFLVAKMRLSLAAILLIGGLLLYDRKLLYLPRKEWRYFALLGVGMAAGQFSYLYAISLTNVATAVFLQYLGPVFMAAYAFLWQKTDLGWAGFGAVALATLGGLLIMLHSGGMSGGSLLGIVGGLGAAVTMAWNTIYSQRAVREYRPLTVVAYCFGFGAILWWILMPGWDAGAVTTDQWQMFLFMASFSTVLPYLLYFLSVRFLPPTNVGVTASMEPVIAAAVAFLALGETMGWLQLIGGGLVIAAVVLLQVAPSPAEPAGDLAQEVEDAAS